MSQSVNRHRLFLGALAIYAVQFFFVSRVSVPLGALFAI